jgi:hypothetical protein
MVQPCLNGAPLSSIRAGDGNHVLAPKTTMGGPQLFLPESTRCMGRPVLRMCWSSRGKASFKESWTFTIHAMENLEHCEPDGGLPVTVAFLSDQWSLV